MPASIALSYLFISLSVIILMQRPTQKALRTLLAGAYLMTFLQCGHILMALKEHGASDFVSIILSAFIIIYVVAYAWLIPNPHTMTFERILAHRLITALIALGLALISHALIIFPTL